MISFRPKIDFYFFLLGVWTPGAGSSPGEATPSVGINKRPAVNGEVSSSPKAAPAAPPPPPPPPPPIWSPTTKKASPVPEKKEFRPVAFESPKPIRKQINQDQQNPEVPCIHTHITPENVIKVYVFAVLALIVCFGIIRRGLRRPGRCALPVLSRRPTLEALAGL